MGVDGLIERLARATGPDRELDAAIDVVVFRPSADRVEYFPDGQRIPSGFYNARAIPAYTGSLDAAVTLVPEGWGWGVQSGYPYEGRCYPALAYYWILGDDPGVANSVDAAAPAHAICIAALKAREVSDGRD